MRRPWEVWNPIRSLEVDSYWRSSADEMLRRRQLADLLTRQMRSKELLLEVGCGTGLIYEALRANLLSKKQRYVGVDNSKAMLAIAKRRYPGADFRDADAYGLPFENDHYDVACAFEVFGHMPDCELPLAELLRVTKRLAVFTFWTNDDAELQDGGEHYIYPTSWIYLAIAKAMKEHGSYAVSTQPVGPTLAFLVEKTA